MPQQPTTKPKLTTGLLRALWLRRQAGETTGTLAAEIQREGQVLRQYWRRLGFYSSSVIRQAQAQKNGVVLIYTLRAKGVSFNAIAAALGLLPTPRTVRMLHNRLARYCSRIGVPLPRRSRASVEGVTGKVERQTSELLQ